MNMWIPLQITKTRGSNLICLTNTNRFHVQFLRLVQLWLSFPISKQKHSMNPCTQESVHQGIKKTMHSCNNNVSATQRTNNSVNQYTNDSTTKPNALLSQSIYFDPRCMNKMYIQTYMDTTMSLQLYMQTRICIHVYICTYIFIYICTCIYDDLALDPKGCF